jgi:protein-arginine kinase activator protein McsA
MQRYADSTDCDACGEENEDFHPANISNGIVTYLIHVCASCVPDHS